jgi:hypothetical protein
MANKNIGKTAYKRVRNPIMKQAPTKAKIKVRLDSRTIITLPDMSAFKMWKEKYPGAVILSS